MEGNMLLLRNVLMKTPFFGNLIPAKYVLTFVASIVPNKKVVYNSARCMCDDIGKGITLNLVITDSELVNAHLKFVRYYDALSDEMRSLQVGKLVWDSFRTKRKGITNTHVDAWYIRLAQNDLLEPMGYMFSNKELDRIIERTKLVTSPICKPTLFQRLVLKLNNLLFGHNFNW